MHGKQETMVTDETRCNIAFDNHRLRYRYRLYCAIILLSSSKNPSVKR